MNSLEQLPAELAFLADIIGDRSSQYQTATWLKCDFSAKTWKCVFGGKEFTLDFQVAMEDGSLLSEPRHGKLLDTFKFWMCVQTHPDLTGGRELSDLSAYHRVSRVLHLIDYFLMNGQRFQLATHGLSLVTESELRHLIVVLANYKETTQSIYQWDERLSDFLRKHGNSLRSEEVSSIIASNPSIADIDVDPEVRTLFLSDSELICARAYLWANGYYRNSTSQDFRHAPSTRQLAGVLYPNTLRGESQRRVPQELCISPIDRYHREYPAVPVRTGVGEQRSTQALQTYVDALRSLGCLAELNLQVPLSALDAVSSKGFLDSLDTRPNGRTRTPPQSMVFASLKNSIEYGLEYGPDLVESYLSLLRKASEEDKTIAAYAVDNDIIPHLTPKIRALGVRTWHLGQDMASLEPHLEKGSYSRSPSAEYFRRLRNNEGLWELLRILVGAVIICVGTLMARRKGELCDLIADRSLDELRKYLIFENRKSGTIGIRQREARPIPPIAAELIGILESLQKQLVEEGYLPTCIELFAAPDRFGRGFAASYSTFSDALDIFCDYFETPLNGIGQRYYIRQHQLRRFFAMLFFWGNSFGGLDTLRWFLGHTDVEHLYHYITEATTGSVLQSVKASFAADCVKHHVSDCEELADLLEEHFGTRDFSVLDSDELDDYLQDLIEDGIVDVEPQFFDTAAGHSYRVLILVKRERHAN